MSVVVAMPSIAKQWRDNSRSMIGVRSKAPVEMLLEIVSAAVRLGNGKLPLGYMFVDPGPTPQGVAFYVEDADARDSVLGLVDDIAEKLKAAGFDARIGPLNSDPYLRGEPYWDARVTRDDAGQPNECGTPILRHVRK